MNVNGPVPQPDEDDDHERWLALLANDDAAPRLLEAALTHAVPMPGWMSDTAAIAWRTRDFDADLAELLDTHDFAETSRDSTSTDRVLRFRAASIEFEIIVRDDASGTIVDGVVSGPSASDLASLSLSWEQPGGSSDVAPVDQFGRFSFEPGDASLARVRLASPSVITPFFRVR
jgi:hypothetical protein